MNHDLISGQQKQRRDGRVAARWSSPLLLDSKFLRRVNKVMSLQLYGAGLNN